MQYKVNNPTIPKLQELARISFNLRFWEKKYKEEYGFNNRNNMCYWQNRMDVFLAENIEPQPETEVKE